MNEGLRYLSMEAEARHDISLMRMADVNARGFFKDKYGFFWKWKIKKGEFIDKSIEIYKELCKEFK